MRARRVRSLAPFVFPLALLAAASFAEGNALELDPTQSAIHFTLKSSLHTVHGTLTIASGKLRFHPIMGKATGLIVVSAASGESGNRGRDSRMRKKIIESQRYPEITFAPHDIEGSVEIQGDSQVEVKGNFAFWARITKIELLHCGPKALTLLWIRIPRSPTSRGDFDVKIIARYLRCLELREHVTCGAEGVH